jgi:hypothetical protein
VTAVHNGSTVHGGVRAARSAALNAGWASEIAWLRHVAVAAASAISRESSISQTTRAAEAILFSRTFAPLGEARLRSA